MEARVFGWLWLLLAGALLCYGSPDRRIEIRGQVSYDEKTDAIQTVTMKMDRCLEYNFRKNFYYAVTSAGFVRVLMDQAMRTQERWNFLKENYIYIEDWEEDLEGYLKRNMDKKCYNNDKFKVFYYDENRLIFLRFGEHNSYVRFWITENLNYKYDIQQQRMRDAVGQTDTVIFRQPCYIRVNRQDLRESHEMLIVPYKKEYKFAVPKDEYYDDQDAVDVAVQSKAQKPVKVKLAVSTQFNVILSVLLAIAGFAF
ncbi:hypothetical protein QR680_014132 [Steinernema hermaphroditum]|uniref:Uncharacterized protein n=1 Tax=Steinernema hermaphroditum TaxID=289476 RepID=A0AA39M3D5_9BILA|nr:hypothetical protein QR680_014132 [Steinernema hermaphroditum]